MLKHLPLSRGDILKPFPTGMATQKSLLERGFRGVFFKDWKFALSLKNNSK